MAPGLVKFSNSGAQARGVPWLSMQDPSDAALVRDYLVTFLEEGTIPEPLKGSDPEY